MDSQLTVGTLDQQFLASWVNGKSPRTQKAYLTIGGELLEALAHKNLREADLPTIQRFIELKASPQSKRMRTAVVKSLFTFGVKTGYLAANLGAFLPTVKTHNRITERYLTEDEVLAMIHLTKTPRDQALLRLLYSSGVRVSELAGIDWEHVQPRDKGQAQITIVGKGNKKRTIKISKGTYFVLLRLKTLGMGPVFISREGGRLSVRMIQSVVDQARARAGIDKKVSPHWLRHCHASHALDRGCALHVLQAQLGHEDISTTGLYAHARPQESSADYLGI